MQTIEYKEGYQAFIDGDSHLTNPYKDDADKYDDWSQGYFDASDEEE